MWSRDRGLGLETVSRPKNAVLVSNVPVLVWVFRGAFLVLKVWSWSWASGLGHSPLVLALHLWFGLWWELEWIICLKMLSIFSAIRELSYYYEASNSCADPPKTKRERLFAS